MKILVPVKWVIDYNVRVRVKEDNSGVELDNVKMAMNPFDEISVEEAIRIKEKGIADEIIAVTIGRKQDQTVLRNALAMGADRAIHVITDEQTEPLGVAKILKEIVKAEKPDLVIMGKQAIDDDCNQTPQMLASLLEWPQATYVEKVEIINDKIEVTRQTDTGVQNIIVNLPAVISTDLRLNEPRYASLPNIMKARRKNIEIKDIFDYKLNIENRVQIITTEEAPKRKTGVIVKDVDELLDKLRNEAKVL